MSVRRWPYDAPRSREAVASDNGASGPVWRSKGMAIILSALFSAFAAIGIVSTIVAVVEWLR